MNWWGSIKKSLPEAVRQLPATYFYKSTGPGTIAGNHEWEQIVELASGRLGAELEGACEGQRAELESGEAVLNVDDSKPLVEGWLAKQTILHSTTNRTPWRNRYFILKRGCIHYYDVIAEDAIHLKDFAVEHESSRLPIKLEGTEKFGYLLTLVFDQPIEGREAAGVKDDMANRMLYLAAESEEEKNNWLDWFVNVALGSESEQRKGWLMVRDKRTRAWKNRYFTLKGKTLHQHHRDQKGIFPLAGAEVWSRDGFSFSVKAKSGKILNLMADGQDVRDKWLQLILRVIKHYQANELHQTILEKEDYDMLDFTHKVKDWVDTERARVEKRVQDFLASGASCPPTSSPDGKFRILSIDGGGMRGLMNCILLSRLLMVFPDLFEKVNFWVGTSNGGMLAMAFAFGYSPALCRTLLELAGTKVFIKREGYTGVLNRAKFSSQALKILCDEVYGKLTLAQCPSFVLLPSLLLDNHAPDALQRACENRYYHNLPKRKDDRERRRRAVSFNTLRQRQQREQERRTREREAASQQAARPPSEARPPSPALAYKASSGSGRDEDHHHDHHHQQQEGPPSSPFFEIGSSPVDTSRPRPPAASSGGGPEHGEGEGEGEADPRANEMLSETASDLVMRTIAAPTYFPSHQQHVDGGMFAHDPASSALTLAISPYWLNKKLDEVVLLSFGTGKVNHYYEDDSHDWGYMQWVPKLAGVLWDGMIMQSEQMCHELLGDRYFRFNPVLQTEIPLDNPEAVPLLVDIALNIELGPLVAWINENFYSAAKADRGGTSASDAASEEANPPAEGARGRVGSAAAQGRRVAFAASSSSGSSKAKGESYDASAEGDDHDTDTDTDTDVEGEGEGEGEGRKGERRRGRGRRRRSRMRLDQEGQVKREREAIEVWERREQEEQERRERIERMEREKRERERRDREERERREQAERERVEREEREEREREQQRREAREREARERGDKEARERQEAQEREAREEEERRQREMQEREERERREREELEAIERRAQQMREIEEIERKAREERERLERARRKEEEEEAERERLLREAEAEEERRQTQEREELRRRLREEEEARLAREAEERREREEKLLLEREAEEREARRRQEEVRKADKQTRPVGGGGGGGMNFFEQEFTFEEAVLLAEEGAPLPPPSQQQPPPPLPHRRAGPPHTLAAPVVNSPVDDLFSFLTTPAGMGGGKTQDSSAGTTTSGGATSAVLDTPAAAANSGKKQPANLDDFFW